MTEPTLLLLSRRFWVWALFGALAFTLIYLVKGILLPFATGLLVAYLLNPAVSWFEEKKIPRIVATTVFVLLFFFTIAGTLFFTFPFLKQELLFLAQHLPSYGARMNQTLMPFLDHLSTYIHVDDFNKLKETASTYFGDMLSWFIRAVAGVLTNTLAIANLISMVVLTPVVSFYLLRDWPKVIETVRRLLPRDYASTIQNQAALINQTLAEYVRGQAIVCLVLAVVYAGGLLCTGLGYAVTIGVATGLLAFIPYFGFLLGASVGLSLAFAQFPDWSGVGSVALVFAIGQVLESYVLTPKLVGERIGLHPVWILFALLAGGILFGFLGIVLAMPLAATLGVLVRFFLDKYLESDFYKGHPATPKKRVQKAT